MDKFMFLFRGGNHAILSPEEMQAHMQHWFKWMDELRAKDILVATGPLQPVGMQLAGRGKTVTDGPYVEAKEMVGGYTIITAGSLEDAVEIAKDCPNLDVDGKVEVRPFREITRP